MNTSRCSCAILNSTHVASKDHGSEFLNMFQELGYVMVSLLLVLVNDITLRFWWLNGTIVLPLSPLSRLSLSLSHPSLSFYHCVSVHNSGARVNAKDNKWLTPLHRAVASCSEVSRYTTQVHTQMQTNCTHHCSSCLRVSVCRRQSRCCWNTLLMWMLGIRTGRLHCTWRRLTKRCAVPRLLSPCWATWTCRTARDAPPCTTLPSADTSRSHSALYNITRHTAIVCHVLLHNTVPCTVEYHVIVLFTIQHNTLQCSTIS